MSYQRCSWQSVVTAVLEWSLLRSLAMFVRESHSWDSRYKDIVLLVEKSFIHKCVCHSVFEIVKILGENTDTQDYGMVEYAVQVP